MLDIMKSSQSRSALMIMIHGTMRADRLDFTLVLISNFNVDKHSEL